MRSVAAEPTLTYFLIALNVLVGIGSLMGGGGGFSESGLTDDGGLSAGTIRDGEYWRLVTSGFLHGGLFHLLANMLALYILGTMIEPALGRWRFGLIYFVSLLCGSFGALVFAPDSFTVGASGAVFGLMGGAAVLARSRGFSLWESGLGLWIGINLLITFTIPNISIGGHIGGIVGGAVAGLLLVELGERGRLPRYVPEALCIAIGVAAVAGAIVVAEGAA
jgi:membrane associated rhomboid family serine protease